MNNVFFILTPLQLLNALEARRSLVSGPSTLIVLTSGYSKKQLELLIDERDWQDIHYFTLLNEQSRRPNRFRWHYQSYRVKKQLEQLARNIGKVDKLFLGNYDDLLARHFSNALSHKALYLLDDGTTTLDINRYRIEGVSTLPFLEHFKAQWRNVLLGYNLHEAETLTFFTSYDLEPKKGDQVIKNSYQSLRQHVAETVHGDEVLFLGQPLVEDGEMRLEVYADYVQKAQTHYRGQNLIYMPHKRELPENVARLERQLGLSIRRDDLPIEFLLSQAATMPKELASFFCTALDNCRLIFGESLIVTAFYIEPEDLEREKAFVESVYAYLQTKVGPAFRVKHLSATSSDTLASSP